MDNPEDVRLFIHKKKNDYLRSVLEQLNTTLAKLLKTYDIQSLFK